VAAVQSLGAEAIQIIVNATNPISGLRRQTVSELFLKEATTWPDGIKAAPVDLSEQSPARKSFSRLVHGRDTLAIKAYWQKMIFAGKMVPPPEKASPEEVVDYVRAHAGAIGYVPVGTAVGRGVKVVSLTDSP
jgi:ABC-type phosphate transport system substrate-binding protein